MIDARKTGAYIAQMRREKDWTQMELAERLHVTHQAVSRWETGDSFPDIAVMARLAQLFGVRVDDLLNGGATAPQREPMRGDVLSELAQGHTETVARMARDDPEDLETVIDAGPLTRPSVMNEVVKNMSGYTFTLDQIAELAPFVSQEALRSLVEGLDGGPPLGIDGLIALAPFLDVQTLDRLADRVPEGTLTADQLMELAPFMRREKLDHLVDLVAEGSLDRSFLEALAPFVSSSSLEQLVERVEAGDLTLEWLSEIAPFLNRSTLERLMGRVESGEISSRVLVELAPFIGSEALGRMVERAPKGVIDTEMLIELAPFLDRSMLDGILHSFFRAKEE